MILYIHGPDTFRSRQYLRHSIDQFKKQRDPGGYNVVLLDGKTVESSKLLAELKSAPFLAEKRLVVIDNILSSSHKEVLQCMVELISNASLPESTVAMFWQGEPLGKVKEVKELEALLLKQKFAQEFAPLVGSKLGAWITKEAAVRNGVLEPAAVQYIVDNVGSDMWLLNSLVDQLVAYAKGTAVTVSQVKLFLDEKVDDNVFNMIEAMVGGNVKQAFKLIAEQRRLGEEDGKLFGLFLWQFRILIQIADVLESDAGATSDVVARQLGIHPFVAKKNFAVARRYSLARLHKVYRELLDIDIKTKTGQGDQSLLIDRLVRTLA